MLTCQIIIDDPCSDLERTLSSLEQLSSKELFVIKAVDSEAIRHSMERHHIKSYNTELINDYSKVRNRLIKESSYDWQLIIKPGEPLTDHELVDKALINDPVAYSLPILSGDVLHYEPRLWHRSSGLRFKNQVCEYLDVADKDLTLLDATLYREGESLPDIDRLRKWREEKPESVEPIYYEAFYWLGKGDWEKFLSYSSQYLFQSRLATKPTLQMKYYTAVVLCHIKQNAQTAVQHTLECLAMKPLYAEYWCLLGDIFYHQIGDYHKAKQFYRNAMILGSKRNIDFWPIELSKYDGYPQKMIKACDELISSSKILRTQRSS